MDSKLANKLRSLLHLIGLLGKPSGIGIHELGRLVERAHGAKSAAQWHIRSSVLNRIATSTPQDEKILDANPLSKYLAEVKEGRGVVCEGY